MLHLNEIRRAFANKLNAEDFEVDKSGVKVLELIGTVFIADDDFIFGSPNHEYIQDEIRWYYSMSRKPEDLRSTPKIWKDITDFNGYVNSNYGWCLFSNEHTDTYEHNHDQYKNVLHTLKKHPSSRQAVAIYTRPSMHRDAFTDGRSDFMCTNTVQYVIRKGKLDTIVNMRSNDAVFGYKNDWAWQWHISQKLAEDLDCPVGTIYWQTGSLHVYERHFKFVEEWMAKRENALNQMMNSEKNYVISS